MMRKQEGFRTKMKTWLVIRLKGSACSFIHSFTHEQSSLALKKDRAEEKVTHQEGGNRRGQVDIH